MKGALGLYFLVMLSATYFDLRERQIPDVHWWISGTVGLLVMGYRLYTTTGLLGALLTLPLFSLLSVLLVGYPSLEDIKKGSALDLLFLFLYAFSVLVLFLALKNYTNNYLPALIAILFEAVFLSFYFLNVGGIYLLHGGADVKALQVHSIVLPTFSYIGGIPTFTTLGVPSLLLSMFPPPLTTLINAALISVLISVVYFSVVNLKSGGAPLKYFFTAQRLTLERAKRGHWWLYVEDEDGNIKKVDSEEVEEEGLDEGVYWATPKTPFILYLTIGFLITLLAGNLLLPVIYVIVKAVGT
ncbi:MAG: hypothetical protein J7L88_00670 [Thermoplasmata archaeon]|nr:hypothetical protein [Thermoplasmata archaeon]